MTLNRHKSVILAILLAVVTGLIAVVTKAGVQAQATLPERTATPPGTLLPNYGLRARIPESYWGRPGSVLADPSRDRLYISANEGAYIGEDPGLYVIDTRRATPLTTIEGLELYHMTLTRDGTRLVAYTPLPTEPGRLLVFDAETLAPIDEFPLVCAPETETCSVADMAVGPDDRLYWITYGESLVNVLDVATGDVIDRFVAADDAPINRIEIAGADLFAFERVDNNYSRQMRRYDISTTTAALELTAPDEYGGYEWFVAPDGSYLIGSGSFGVIQYSVETLQPIRTIFDGGWQHRIGGIVISLDSERVVIMESVLNGNQPLYGYDANTGEVVITGMVDLSHIAYPSGDFPMAALADGEVAVGYARTVDIFYSADHAVAVPITLANHCAGGPVFDDFSNPNSGWPSRVADGLVYGYIDNEYTILQQEADRWFGVSRGDKWVSGRRVAIATRLTGAEGLSGLIYGLNDEWSLFYTFEVIPSLERWVVFEYREDIGWTLLLTGIEYDINPVGEWNELEVTDIYDATQLLLSVNGRFIGSLMPNRDGRIGLSGGSFAPDFEARYDNYAFVGQNCSLYGRADELDFAPPITRPPLESFLKELPEASPQP